MPFQYEGNLLVPTGLGQVGGGCGGGPNVVQLKWRPRSGAARDAYGHWPHLLYRVGQNTAGALPAYSTPTAQPAPAEYHDDGEGLYCPLEGNILVVGGSGSFDITLFQSRPDECCPAYAETWKLTSYSIDSSRVDIKFVPLGIGTIEVTGPTRVELVYDNIASFALDMVPGQPASANGAKEIHWSGPANGGQLIMRGRL